MGYTAAGLIFLAGIIDGTALILAFLFPRYAIDAIFIHLILYLHINNLVDKLLDRHNGVPNYLALFMPGLGSILIAVSHFSLIYFRRDSIVLDDYERYINFQRFWDQQERVDYDKELQTLSFLDQMNLLDAKSKKQLIVDFGMNQYEERVKILHKGLSDMDGEVQHYSAVTINMLENEYTRVINQLRERFNLDRDIDSLKRLAKAYENYMESGLLSGDVLQVFNKEYIETLLKLIERKKETPEVLHELINAYIRSKDLVQAETVNNRLLKKHPDSIEGLINQIHFAYEKRAFSKVNELVKDIKSLGTEQHPQIQTVLSYWLSKEEMQ